MWVHALMWSFENERGDARLINVESIEGNWVDRVEERLLGTIMLWISIHESKYNIQPKRIVYTLRIWKELMGKQPRDWSECDFDLRKNRDRKKEQHPDISASFAVPISDSIRMVLSDIAR